MPAGQLAQRAGVARGEHEEPRLARRLRPAGRRLGPLGQDRVHVGAGEAEGAQPRHPPAGRRLPGEGLGRDAKGQRVPPHVGAGRVEVQVGRERAVFELQHHLEQAGDASRRLEVPEVGLHRGDVQRLGAVPARGEDGRQGAQLDRVAEGRAGAVGLDARDRPRLQPGALQGGADHALLGGAVGHREPAAGAVLADGRAQHLGQDPVAVRQRVRAALQHRDAGALAAPVAVGRGREGLAAPVGGEHVRLGEDQVAQGRDDEVDAAHQGRVALPAAQALAGRVQGVERGRAGGVERHRGAGEVQRVGDSTGRRAVGHAGARGGPHVAVRQVGAHVGREVHGADPHEHPGRAAAQGLGRETGVLEGLPGDLQQQPLLGVEVGRLARGDAEELRVEGVALREEGAAPGDHLARRVGVGVVVGGRAPAVGGDLAGRVGARREEPP